MEEVLTVERACHLFAACEEFIINGVKPKDKDFIEFAREIRPAGRLSLVDYAMAAAVVWRRMAQAYAAGDVVGMGQASLGPLTTTTVQ